MSVNNDVLAANQAFYRAFEKKDLEAMGNIWSQGTSTICVHPGSEVLQGWQPIINSWSQIFRNTEYLEIDLDIVSVEVESVIAYVVVVENVLQISQGRRLQAQSLATNMFRLMGQTWYIIHHHGSPIMR